LSLFTLLSSPFLTTVQDLGRAGFERLGVPQGGAMDRFALLAANALVGNPPGAAALEFALQGPELVLEQDGLLALTGPGWQLEIGGRLIPPWMAAYARAGERIRALGGAGCAWGTLALAGGIAVPPVMGSRSTYLRGGFGGLDGRALRAGDRLPLGECAPPSALLARAGESLSPAALPPYAQQVTLRVIPGPQAERFTQRGWRTFLSSAYTLNPLSDRMGYRLGGPPVEHTAGADILSEGVVMGSLQVPGSGELLALMADRQTTGGYTKIATVISADLPLLAQLVPGSGTARFALTDPASARSAWLARMEDMRSEEPNDRFEL
jgi:antagonist of KipI